MTEEEALKVFFTYNKRARMLVERLMSWSADKTVFDNAMAMGVSLDTSCQMKIRYKLKAQREDRRKKWKWDARSCKWVGRDRE